MLNLKQSEARTVFTVANSDGQTESELDFYL